MSNIERYKPTEFQGPNIRKLSIYHIYSHNCALLFMTTDFAIKSVETLIKVTMKWMSSTR